MSAMQRTKGQSGEREVAHILTTALGINISRNWEPQFEGGAFDLKGLPGWAIEVKRAKSENIRKWWCQATEQSENGKLKPALIFRVDGCGRGLDLDEKWQVVINLSALISEIAPMQTAFKDCYDLTVQMSLRAWISILLMTGKYQPNEILVPF